MSMISQQINRLKSLAVEVERSNIESAFFRHIADVLREGAKTIEDLSAKLASANMERSTRCYEWDAFEKIIERLEDQKTSYIKSYESVFGQRGDISCAEAIGEAIGIVNQVAEEFATDTNVGGNDGWIPVSSGKLPEDCTIYEVTAQFRNGMCYTEFAYYDESRGEWWKHDYDGLINVLAWKDHSVPYQPKGE